MTADLEGFPRKDSEPEKFLREAHCESIILTAPETLRDAEVVWVSTIHTNSLDAMHTYACNTPDGVYIAHIADHYDESEVFVQPLRVHDRLMLPQ